jgi:hypothetical protein
MNMSARRVVAMPQSSVLRISADQGFNDGLAHRVDKLRTLRKHQSQ